MGMFAHALYAINKFNGGTVDNPTTFSSAVTFSSNITVSGYIYTSEDYITIPFYVPYPATKASDLTKITIGYVDRCWETFTFYATSTTGCYVGFENTAYHITPTSNRAITNPSNATDENTATAATISVIANGDYIMLDLATEATYAMLFRANYTAVSGLYSYQSSKDAVDWTTHFSGLSSTTTRVVQSKCRYMRIYVNTSLGGTLSAYEFVALKNVLGGKDSQQVSANTITRIRWNGTYGVNGDLYVLTSATGTFWYSLALDSHDISIIS